MNTDGSEYPDVPPPLWLLAELTYACPLQCPYCSNPVAFARYRKELSTDQWRRVLQEGRALGAVQLGFSGGEPLLRRDLEELVCEARQLGYYSNLITSGVGLNRDRIRRLRESGLDHIQLSFQAATRELNDFMAGTAAFEHKKAMAREIKASGYPMVLCFVLYRNNIEQIPQMLALADELAADYVELANTQYHGWALVNRDALLPTAEQLAKAEDQVNRYRDQQQGPMKIYYVAPDYFDGRPKACVNGWGSTFLTVAPDGTVLPCHSARELPGMDFPSVSTASLAHIWQHSELFNRFRGTDWMPEPCRSCPEKDRDFGGCRCQAYMLTGDSHATDPACSKSPHHGLIKAAINAAADTGKPFVFRNPRQSAQLQG